MVSEIEIAMSRSDNGRRAELITDHAIEICKSFFDVIINILQCIDAGCTCIKAKLLCEIEMAVRPAQDALQDAHARIGIDAAHVKSERHRTRLRLVTAARPVLGSTALRLMRTEASSWGVSEDSSRPG